MTGTGGTGSNEAQGSGEVQASDEAQGDDGPHGPTVRADIARMTRTGEPEIVYAAGKSAQQTVTAVTALVRGGVRPVIVSRAGPEHVAAVIDAHPDATHHADARMLVIGSLSDEADRAGDADDAGTATGIGASADDIVVVTAGTSDLGVAAECVCTLRALGHRPLLLADVGVAGLHRVLEVRESLAAARVVVVVAGMEAALGPVVAGLVRAPVIAVPTSVGYGAAQGGLTAMHGLLASCAPGIGVVNIDNGLGAALLARRILEGAAVS